MHFPECMGFFMPDVLEQDPDYKESSDYFIPRFIGLEHI